MRKNKIIRWSTLGLSFLLLVALMMFSNREVYAAAYEFWGTEATIGCHTVFSPSREEGMDVSVNGRVIVASAKANVVQELRMGNEVTCNGWRFTSCGGTNCQLF